MLQGRSGAGNIQQVFVGGDLAGIGVEHGLADRRRHSPEADGDGQVSWAGRPAQLGYINLRLEPEGAEMEDVRPGWSWDDSVADLAPSRLTPAGK